VVVSKTGVVLWVLVFFSVLSVFIGLYEQHTFYELEDTGKESVSAGTINFLPAVVQGYKDLPTAFNVVIFGSLGVMLSWLVVSSLPTFSGGS